MEPHAAFATGKREVTLDDGTRYVIEETEERWGIQAYNMPNGRFIALLTFVQSDVGRVAAMRLDSEQRPVQGWLTLLMLSGVGVRVTGPDDAHRWDVYINVKFSRMADGDNRHHVLAAQAMNLMEVLGFALRESESWKRQRGTTA